MSRFVLMQHNAINLDSIIYYYKQGRSIVIGMGGKPLCLEFDTNPQCLVNLAFLQLHLPAKTMGEFGVQHIEL